jgi:diguanylate cyclase (GGDEF)-like protein
MLVAMMLVLVFSFFGLRVGQARWLALLGFGLLAGVMAYKVSTDPQAYEPRVEMIHLTLAGLFLFAVAVLAGRLTRMRQRLTEQRTALQEALARIQELATRDPLTGLLNRRAMGELMAQEAARAQRLGTPFSVVLFDLDHFKLVNDRLGHVAGDEVLRSFAQVAMGRVRKTDALARWGGEEFLLMLPDTSPACALTVVARVREGLVALPAHIGLPGGVRFSAGVAACGAPEDVQPALERADEALYRAKAAGRDRCLVAA